VGAQGERALLTLILHTGETIDLSAAYEKACHKLSLPISAHKDREVLADLMVRLAKAGERRPKVIVALAVEIMRRDRNATAFQLRAPPGSMR
jgi:hypothetical protein